MPDRCRCGRQEKIVWFSNGEHGDNVCSGCGLFWTRCTCRMTVGMILEGLAFFVLVAATIIGIGLAAA